MGSGRCGKVRYLYESTGALSNVGWVSALSSRMESSVSRVASAGSTARTNMVSRVISIRM